MINVIVCHRTCIACPSQWEGVCDDGRYIYIRFRWGTLTFGVGKTIDDAVDASFNSGHKDLSDSLDGWMTNEQMRDVMLEFDVHFNEITGGD